MPAPPYVRPSIIGYHPNYRTEKAFPKLLKLPKAFRGTPAQVICTVFGTILFCFIAYSTLSSIIVGKLLLRTLSNHFDFSGSDVCSTLSLPFSKPWFGKGQEYIKLHSTFFYRISLFTLYFHRFSINVFYLQITNELERCLRCIALIFVDLNNW